MSKNWASHEDTAYSDPFVKSTHYSDSKGIDYHRFHNLPPGFNFVIQSWPRFRLKGRDPKGDRCHGFHWRSAKRIAWPAFRATVAGEMGKSKQRRRWRPNWWMWQQDLPTDRIEWRLEWRYSGQQTFNIRLPANSVSITEVTSVDYAGQCDSQLTNDVYKL